jgi:hypothetical protein
METSQDISRLETRFWWLESEIAISDATGNTHDVVGDFGRCALTASLFCRETGDCG